MSNSRSLRRLLALRRLTEEREEAHVLHKRQEQQRCVEALVELRGEDAATARARSAALTAGDSAAAMVCDMLLVCSSRLEQRIEADLQVREHALAVAAAAWQEARRARRQVETAWQQRRSGEEQVAARREQQFANEWFLGRLAQRGESAPHEDESVPRNATAMAAESGRRRAPVPTA